MRRLSILFGSAFFLVNFAYAQFSMVDTLTEKFKNYRSQALQEKIYAHVDRTSYLTGETLWFSLYYLDASIHHSLGISKVAYVEIVDKNNDSVVQAKVELKNGKGSGSLFIPASLASGNYVFRVYTHWMKNFSPEFYFHQPITIINSFVKTELTDGGLAQRSIDVHFFPEGGHAVEGIKTKIAFRVTDETGKGIPFTGAIVNSKDNIVLEFNPSRFGIGNFYFMPEAGESYKAVIEDTNGNTKEYPFVEIKKSGYTMSVSDKGDYITIDVEASISSAPLIYLFAHTRQMIVKAEGKILTERKVQFSINTSELQDGITHLTLFNNALEPVCERLFFKRPTAQLKINVESAQRMYKPRDPVQLFLKTNITADVSVSVYRTDSIPSPELQNILEYLWLSSDLKGTIESPEYYFSNTDSTVNGALDNLMLTHGWRRFNWDNVLNSKPYFRFIPEYRGHIIQGKVTQSNGTPAAGILTTLASPDKVFQVYGSRSDANGDVRYEVKNFFEDHQLFVRSLPPADSTLKITVTNPFSTQYARFPFARLNLSSALSKPILTRSVGMQVQSIFNGAQLSKPQYPEIDSVQFFGSADETYYLEDYTRFPQLEEVFIEYVHGVMVRKQKKEARLSVVEILNKPLFSEDPTVFLDGVPVFDTKKILEINSLRIKKLEVLTKEYYYGPLTLHGAILLSSYQHDLAGFEMDDKNLSLNYEGLQLQREFYAPKYDTQDARNSRLPDERTLLYWNASEKITANKNSSIQFYTSDSLGEYKVVVEGLATDGTAGYSVHYFSIKE